MPNTTLGVVLRCKQSLALTPHVLHRARSQTQRAPPVQKDRAVHILAWEARVLGLGLVDIAQHPTPMVVQHLAHLTERDARRHLHMQRAVLVEGDAHARAAAGVPSHFDIDVAEQVVRRPPKALPLESCHPRFLSRCSPQRNSLTTPELWYVPAPCRADRKGGDQCNPLLRVPSPDGTRFNPRGGLRAAPNF